MFRYSTAVASPQYCSPLPGRIAEPRSPLYLALGHTIAHTRGARGYSKAQLARRAGLCDWELLAIEAGELSLPLSTIERLAHALGLPSSVLLREAERQAE